MQLSEIREPLGSRAGRHFRHFPLFLFSELQKKFSLALLESSSSVNFTRFLSINNFSPGSLVAEQFSFIFLIALQNRGKMCSGPPRPVALLSHERTPKERINCSVN